MFINYRDVIKFNKFRHFYRGLDLKIINGILYTLAILGLEKK
jgi:hypothetical protein